MSALVVFSYISTEGAGGNYYVSAVKNQLERRGIEVEMRHGSSDGKLVHRDGRQVGNTTSANYQQW